MRELTMSEYKLVSAAFGPAGAAVGALAGAATYVGAAVGSGKQDASFGGLAESVVAGALGGFIFGPGAATLGQAVSATMLSTQVGFYVGMGGGFFSSFFSDDAAGTNFSGTDYQ